MSGAAPNSFTVHDNQSTMHVNQPPIPLYNSTDYVNQPPVIDPYAGHPSVADPYAGHPPGPAPRNANDHVSANNSLPRQVPTTNSANDASYFPPHPTIPLSDEQLHHADHEPQWTAEEGASYRLCILIYVDIAETDMVCRSSN